MTAAAPTPTQITPIKKVQHNLMLWNDLLMASGRALNPSKCVWFYFHWKQDARGTVKIATPPPSTPNISIYTMHSQPKPIRLLQPPLPRCAIYYQPQLQRRVKHLPTAKQQQQQKLIA